MCTYSYNKVYSMLARVKHVINIYFIFRLILTYYIYIRILITTNTRMHICQYTCMCAHTFEYLLKVAITVLPPISCVCTRACTYTYIRMYKKKCTHTCVCIYAYLHIHTQVDMYVCIKIAQLKFATYIFSCRFKYLPSNGAHITQFFIFIYRHMKKKRKAAGFCTYVCTHKSIHTNITSISKR